MNTAVIYTKEEVMGQIDRNDSFKSDSKVSTGPATLEDYKGSDYDRGHLASSVMQTSVIMWKEKRVDICS